MSHDPITAPAHYTIYPVQPIEISRYLGFNLGNATKYVLRAPWKGGVEDCQKALRYLELERECCQPLMIVPLYKRCSLAMKSLVKFFYTAGGDELWEDIAIQSASFIESLHLYLSQPSDEVFENMRFAVLELKRVLALRDTTGDYYEGMTGLPEREASR